MTKSRLMKADFLSAVFLVIFSLATIISAYLMPLYKQGWYAAPGFTPLLFGIILLAMSTVFLIRCLLRGNWKFRLTKAHWTAFKTSMVVHRVFFIVAAIAAFLFLFGKIPFLLLSTLFLFVTIAYFKGAPLWMNALISIMTATTIWFVFSVIFMVPLT